MSVYKPNAVNLSKKHALIKERALGGSAFANDWNPMDTKAAAAGPRQSDAKCYSSEHSMINAEAKADHPCK